MSRPLCRSILYVDDDPDICEVVRATLCLIAGLEVQTAESGERAIDLAYELRPDLILMDVMMPGLDGPSTFDRLRASPLIRDIPVIFLTAKVLPTEIARFLGFGAIGVIAKPFDPLKLGEELILLWNGMDEAAGARESHDRRPVGAEDRLTSLAEGFLRRTRRDVMRLREILADPDAGGRIVLDEIELIGHSIHGAGAMFGFPLLGEAGGEIERTVEEITASPSRMNAGMLQLRSAVEHLLIELEAAESAASHENQTDAAAVVQGNSMKNVVP
jgi:two-component system, OmpR family, response regulator